MGKNKKKKAEDKVHEVADQALDTVADATKKARKGRKGRSKVKTLLLLAILGGAGAVAYKQLSGGGSSDNWQSSYEPTPPPTAGS